MNRNAVKTTHALAARQNRVVTRTQLIAAGVPDSTITALIAAGHMHRIFSGVYVVGARELEQSALIQAALSFGGRHAMLSHRTAAEVRGLLPVRDGTVHIAVAGRPGRTVKSITAVPMQHPSLDGAPGFVFAHGIPGSRGKPQEAATETQRRASQQAGRHGSPPLIEPQLIDGWATTPVPLMLVQLAGSRPEALYTIKREPAGPAPALSTGHAADAARAARSATRKMIRQSSAISAAERAAIWRRHDAGRRKLVAKCWDEAEFRGLLDPAAIRAELEARRAPGNAEVRRLLEQSFPVTLPGDVLRSRKELAIAKLLRAVDLPKPLFNQRIALAGFTFFADVLFVGVLAVEVDGPQHELARRRMADTFRDATLLSNGLPVLRLTTEWIDTDLPWCADTLVRAYQYWSTHRIGVNEHPPTLGH